MTPTPIILDCDPGHDDAIALLLALGSPELELLGVTTVAGNQTLAKTTANEIMPIVGKLGQMGEIDPADVAAFVKNIKAGKFREAVPEELARSMWASQNGSAMSGISAIARSLC